VFSLDVLNDHLGSAAHVAFAEELSSSMRHATRNKLAIIRNAATYIRRRVGATEAWKADPRIDMFYRMLESELEDANDLLLRVPGSTPSRTPLLPAGCGAGTGLPAARPERRVSTPVSSSWTVSTPSQFNGPAHSPPFRRE